MRLYIYTVVKQIAVLLILPFQVVQTRRFLTSKPQPLRCAHTAGMAVSWVANVAATRKVPMPHLAMGVPSQEVHEVGRKVEHRAQKQSFQSNQLSAN